MRVVRKQTEGRRGGVYYSPPAPPPPSDTERPLFQQGTPLRRMRVLLDADCGRGDPPDRSHQLLLGLLTHPYIEAWRYADEGPPPEADRRAEDRGGEVVPGWVTLDKDESPTGLRDYGVTAATSTGSRETAVAARQFMEIAAADEEADSYAALAPDAAAAQRAADVLAALVAATLDVDLFISTRPYLYEVRRFRPARGVLVIRPEDALPVIGLYLRRQGQFIGWRSTNGAGTATLNRGLFYWMATRALLPQGWRWMTACVRQSAATGDDTLAYHGQSLLLRVDQALRARDEAFAALNQPQDNDTADDALAALDRLLISLMGAVDVSARVAHMVHDLSDVELYQASWRPGTKWLRALRGKNRPLADLAKSSTHGDALTILRLLRNTVHGAALEPLAVSEGALRGRTDTLVGLPAKDATELLACADRQGGGTAWGMRELIPGRLHADIDVLIERLLPSIVSFLNDAMRLTPVDQLEHAHQTEADLGPPQGKSPDNTFAPIRLELVLAQLGLPTAAPEGPET